MLSPSIENQNDPAFCSLRSASNWKPVILMLAGLWQVVTDNSTRIDDQGARDAARASTSAQQSGITGQAILPVPGMTTPEHFRELGRVLQAASTAEGSAAIVHITWELLGVHVSPDDDNNRARVAFNRRIKQLRQRQVCPETP
jgi:hypothetical protein